MKNVTQNSNIYKTRETIDAKMGCKTWAYAAIGLFSDLYRDRVILTPQVYMWQKKKQKKMN